MDNRSRAHSRDAYSSVDLDHGEHVSRNLVAEREKERRRNRCNADQSPYFVLHKSFDWNDESPNAVNLHFPEEN
jgi:hypothetical protein